MLPFGITAVISIGLGQWLFQRFRQAEQSRLRHAFMTVAVAWAMIPCLGALPFVLMPVFTTDSTNVATLSLAELYHPLNALFESMSGFTSTGLSMVLHPQDIPRSLQWWRSFTEWVGGVGVVVLAMTVQEPATDEYQLYSAEGRRRLIGLTLRQTARRIWWIYLLYTGLSVGWFRLVGMTWWEALNHGMAGIATGGFAITDDSIGHYSLMVQAAVIPVMILGSISFSVHDRVLRQRQIAILWRSPQHRLLWILLGAGAVALVLENSWFRSSSLWLDAIFQWVSALGTCGFSTTDIQTWSPTAKLLLMIAMICGGTAGSTVGGLKLQRVVSLIQGVLWRFRRFSLQPHQMMRYELNGEVVTEAEANRHVAAAAVLATLWLGAIAVGTIVLLHIVLPEYRLEDVLFETASALGSVGLSSGITHPDMAASGKVVLIVLMWMGRLEIIPVLLIMSWPLGYMWRQVTRLMQRSRFRKPINK